MNRYCHVCNEPLDYRLQCRCTREVREPLAKAKRGCQKCGETNATITEMAATGTGLSRLMNFQYQQYVVVSCESCGYSELYRKQTSKSMNFLDLFFGG